MRVTHLLNIRNKLVRQFTIRIKASVIMYFPWADVDFVYIHRLRQSAVFTACTYPSLIAPFVIIWNILCYGRSTRSQFTLYSIRICFVISFSVLSLNSILIQHSFFYICKKAIPNSTCFYSFKHFVIAVPIVEIAHDSNTYGFRCPNGKSPTVNTVYFDFMWSKHFIWLKIVTGIK